MRTPDDVRREFSKRGISISAWARANGFSVPLVYQVVSGERKAVRGQSHDIAVALGLKQGEIGNLNDLPFPGAKVPKS